MRAGLEKAGVVFVEENGGGPGVRLREKSDEAACTRQGKDEDQAEGIREGAQGKGLIMYWRAILLAILIATPALADKATKTSEATKTGGFDTGNELFENCHAKELTWAYGLCQGYIVAIADVTANNNGYRVCIPTGEFEVNVINAVVRYVDRNAPKRHLAAAVLVVEALQERFPCQSE